PEAKRRIEEAEKEHDRHVHEQHNHKESSTPLKSKRSDEGEGHHNDNEITPGEDDPTVNDNVKFPVLNDHGDIEYKSQQGSVFKRHKNDNSTHET
ncbi:unnamed protein product, partial [Adineta steineri]